MSTLSDPYGDAGTWHACAGCGASTGLPPGTDTCPDCQSDPDAYPLAEPVGPVQPHTRPSHAEPLRAEHFTAGDLMDIWLAGGTFAAAVEDISHHYIGDPGTW